MKYAPEDLIKSDLIHEIICQIQNLLPNTCSLCDRRYRVDCNVKSLLECAICGQGIHQQCWEQLVQVKQPGVTDHATESFKTIYNPLNMDNLFYICKPCSEVNIPEKKERKRKPASKKKDLQTKVSINPTIQIVDSDQNLTLQMTSALTNASEPEFVSAVTSTNESLANDVSTPGPLENDSSYEPQDKSPKTCRYFVKGSCLQKVHSVWQQATIRLQTW